MWKELEIGTHSVYQIMILIYDMLDEGYELKVEDHKIWYR